MISPHAAPLQGIRKSIRMIRGGTLLFIVNIVIPLALAGIGFLLFIIAEHAALPDIVNLETVAAVFEEMEVNHMKGSDSYTITCADGTRYGIGHIYSHAFDNQSFERVMQGDRIYVTFDETEEPYRNGIQPIYALSTDDTVYLSADHALDALYGNAALGKVMFPVLSGIAALYLCLFLFAMTNPQKHVKLLKLFIHVRPEDIAGTTAAWR